MIKLFDQLCEEIMNFKPITYNCGEILHIIDRYVIAIEQSRNEHNQWIVQQIRNAPELRRIAFYNYEPGTGQASAQFYKYAKAIRYGNVNCSKITSEKIILILRNYLEDQME